MGDFFNDTESAAIGAAFDERTGCRDRTMVAVETGPLRRDAPFYHSGTVRISCNGIAREYMISDNNSNHVEIILDDIRSGVFDRQ